MDEILELAACASNCKFDSSAPMYICSFYQATDTDDGKYAKVNRQFLLFLHLKCIREEVKR